MKTLQPALTAWSKIDVILSSAQLRSERHEGPHHPERVLKILDRDWQAGLFHRFTLGNAPMQPALFEVAFWIGRLGELIHGRTAKRASPRRKSTSTDVDACSCSDTDTRRICFKMFVNEKRTCMLWATVLLDWRMRSTFVDGNVIAGGSRILTPQDAVT